MASRDARDHCCFSFSYTKIAPKEPCWKQDLRHPWGQSSKNMKKNQEIAPISNNPVVDPVCYKPWNSISNWTFHLTIFQDFCILQRNHGQGIGIGIYFRNVTSSPTNWLAIYRETYNSINVTFSIKCLSSDILLFSSKNKSNTCVFATAVVFALDTHALDVRRFAVWWCPALTLWKRIGSANAKSWKKM